MFNNAGPNKIDVYLQRDLRYTATVDERTGAVDSTLELTLTNTADPDELPPNKIDVYLERELRYTATVDERTGAVDSTLELTLTNTADPDELPSRWSATPPVTRSAPTGPCCRCTRRFPCGTPRSTGVGS